MIDALPLPARLRDDLALREAQDADLDAIVALLADDPVSAARGDTADPAARLRYAAGLAAITADARNAMLVAVSAEEVVGTFQLTVIPGVARAGATRLQVEAVRVAAARRSGGVGGAMMRWVIDVAAPATGATLLQLTSDVARSEAHRFYERLGFAPSQVGLKLRLPGVTPAAG